MSSEHTKGPSASAYVIIIIIIIIKQNKKITQKSPCIHSKNEMGSFLIFCGNSLIINFPEKQIGHEKSFN